MLPCEVDRLSHPSLEVPKEKPTEKRKAKPCAKTTETIHESLKKIKAQVEIFPEFYDRLGKIEMKQDMIVELLTEMTVMLKGRVDIQNALDEKELQVMDALLAKMAK